MIQNADDAGASVVRFYIDYREKWCKSSTNPPLEAYQGQALIAANDAVFTEKDWDGIQRLQDSVKAEDPFNIGKFGIGFNAVYHITGMCEKQDMSAPCCLNCILTIEVTLVLFEQQLHV